MKHTTYKILASVVMSLLLCFSACKKDDENGITPNPPSQGGLVTGIGVPDGEATTKVIGPEGGSITSADTKLHIDIPQGALSSNQTITIQPITNTNVAGKNKAYRISPHGIRFHKEVNITFTFTQADINRTLPEALGIAYQDSTGVWKAIGGATLDKDNKKITIATTHFSDWSFFERFWIEPEEARIDVGEQVELQVMSVDPDVLAPLPKGEERAIHEPAAVKDNFIKEWNLDGEGILGGMKNAQIYQAPDRIPSKNPVAVSVELNLPEPGKFLLVSNITVGDPPHISYLQVDEERSELYIYGSGFALPGGEAPIVTIDGVPVEAVTIYGPTLITCWIKAEGKGSSGPVVVTSNGVKSTPHVLNEWNGTLVYNKPCAGKSNGDLYHKVYFKIRLRGDANPDVLPTETLSPILKSTKLNLGSKAFYEAGGSGQTSFTLDGCGTETVVYTHVEGEAPYYFIDKAERGLGFTGTVQLSTSGFVLNLTFEAREVIPTHYTLVPCKGDPTSKRYNDWIGFGDFESYNDKVNLFFKEENSALSGGRLAKTTYPAPGLHWDNPPTGPSPWKESLADATLTWGEIDAKYPKGIVIE